MRLVSEAAEKIVCELADAAAFPLLGAPAAPSSSQLRAVFTDTNDPSFEAMLALGGEAVRGCVPVSSPFVAAHLHCPPLVTALVAELYIAAMNQSMDSFDQSPTATGWETELIKYLLNLAGLSENGSGVFTSGGTESNLMGLMAARAAATNVDHDYVLCSDQAHFSVAQAARVLGIAPSDVVPIPSTKGRIDPGWASHYIEQRCARGSSPLAIVATAGTTSLGLVDPVAELVALARASGAWIHVDGAYGSGSLFSSSPPSWTRQLGAVDSLSIDFHKMLMQPIPCAVFLAAREEAFDVFSKRADYLNREQDEAQGFVNLVSRSLQTTRRFDALKVIFTLAGIGRRGLADVIDALDTITGRATERLRDSILLDLYCEPDLTTVAFGPTQTLGLMASDRAALVTNVRLALLQAGQAVLGEIRQNGESWWKLTFVNPLATAVDVDELIGRIEVAVNNELHRA